MGALLALVLFLGPTLSLAATIPTSLCALSPGWTLSHSTPTCNTTNVASQSVNLLPMPGGDHTISAHFPFHMADSPIGLVFMDYDHISLIPNIVINQILGHASRAVSASIARQPGLEHQPLWEESEWAPVRNIVLDIDPIVPNLTYWDLRPLFHLLALWAQQYATEECSFEIWGTPGRMEQRKLGTGYFLFES